MNIKELRSLPKHELVKQLAVLRESLRDLNFKVHSKEIKNNHQLHVVKKDIARILTILNQKNLSR